MHLEPSKMSSKAAQLPPELILYFDLLLALYSCFGFLGAAVYTDELDELRVATTAFVGVPVFAFYFMFHWLLPDWHLKWPQLRLQVATLMLVSFAWGNLMLLNAAGLGSSNVVVTRNLNGSLLNLSANKGNLGIIYSRRF